MSDFRIIYRPRPDATRETEAAALATVYRFILHRRAKKGGVPSTADDAKELKDNRAKPILP